MEAHALVIRHRREVKTWLIHASCVLFVFDAAGSIFLVAVLRQEAFFSACGKIGAVLGTLACYLEG